MPILTFSIQFGDFPVIIYSSIPSISFSLLSFKDFSWIFVDILDGFSLSYKFLHCSLLFFFLSVAPTVQSQ